jgi:hypothetical protein
MKRPKVVRFKRKIYFGLGLIPKILKMDPASFVLCQQINVVNTLKIWDEIFESMKPKP